MGFYSNLSDTESYKAHDKKWEEYTHKRNPLIDELLRLDVKRYYSQIDETEYRILKNVYSKLVDVLDKEWELDDKAYTEHIRNLNAGKRYF